MLEDFKVFKLATELYRLCKPLKLPSFLKDQLLRASSSIALNAAEGSGKITPQDQRKYYSICLGSLREVQAILILENQMNPHFKDITDQLGAMLFTLCKAELKRSKTEVSDFFSKLRTSNNEPSN